MVATDARTAPKPKHAKKKAVGEIISIIKNITDITAQVSQLLNIKFFLNDYTDF